VPCASRSGIIINANLFLVIVIQQIIVIVKLASFSKVSPAIFRYYPNPHSHSTLPPPPDFTSLVPTEIITRGLSAKICRCTAVSSSGYAGGDCPSAKATVYSLLT
jgi:hypothetical protein